MSDEKIIEFNENDDIAPLSDNEDEELDIVGRDEQYNDEEGVEIGEPVADDDSIAQLNVHTDDVLRVCVSESMRWLASGSKDNTVTAWDLEAQESSLPYLRILEHDESVDNIAFNAKSNMLASGDISGKIIDECNGLEWIFWHSKADILFAGASDGLIWMWLIGNDGVTQSKVYTSGTASPCNGARLILPDSKILISVYEDCVVRFWDLKEGNVVSTLNLKDQCLQLAAMDVHPTQNLAAIGCKNGSIAVINTTNFKLIEKTDGTTSNEELIENSIEVLKFSPMLNWLAVGTTGGQLTIYDLDTGKARHTCEHEETVINCTWRIAPDTRLILISACFDGAVRAWDAKNGDPVLVYNY